ncbi:hypothetical protein NDU88_004486 [Pleurodeles waltl]|uniref:Uncharacterized protein n=1 Tax=Pleurodeles waltl TaxID=8319 RepID=A0AAV7NTV7_PLEWA|nr:hypothetical protein NDU88_004486 [Pleurodeles waltl]
MRSPGGHTQSGLLTGQLRGTPHLRISLVCVVSQSGGIRLRPPSRRPVRRRQAPPTDAPGRTSPSGRARFRGQRRAPYPTPSEAAAATQRQTTWAQARTSPSKAAPQGRGRTQVAPPASAAPPLFSRSGSSPAQRATAPPAGRAAASSPPRTARDTQGPAPGGQDRTSAIPPSTALAALRSAHRTARLNASRHRCKVGPSGADPSSVRHARLRGHAPGRKKISKQDNKCETQSHGIRRSKTTRSTTKDQGNFTKVKAPLSIKTVSQAPDDITQSKIYIL